MDLLPQKYRLDQLVRLDSTRLNKASKILLKALARSTDLDIKKISKEIIKLNASEISIITKIFSGHNSLNYHFYTMGYWATRTTNTANITQTMKEMLITTKQNTKQRSTSYVNVQLTQT